MNVNYETLLGKYGDSDENKTVEPENPTENAAKEEQQSVPAVEEVPEDVAPIEVENEPVPEQEPQSEEAKPKEAHEETALLDFLKEQRETLTSLEQRMELLDKKVTTFSATIEQIKRAPSNEASISPLVTKIEELRQASISRDKANVDVLRESTNFRATVREQMQRELDGYHRLFSQTANASILTEIATLYIASYRAIGFLTDEKERKNVSEIVLDGMLELLEDAGVVVNSTPIGEKRSVRTCRTRKTIPTGNSELHGLVAASISPSFSLGNQVLIKESVDTYIFDESLALPKEETEISVEEDNTNHDESSDELNVSLTEPEIDVQDDTPEEIGSPEENESKEGTTPEEATCVDEGTTETNTITDSNE